MASPRARGRGKQRSTVTPIRSSPRIVRRSTSYPNAVNRHFVDSVPILEVTLRFEEDEYDIWRRQDTDEVNLFYMLRIKYPKDEDESAWRQELEKLKNELQQVKVIEDGWFEGVWVPLEKAKDIARKYKIYEHVAALLESENSWFDTPKNKQARGKNDGRSDFSDAINGISNGNGLPNGKMNNQSEKTDRPRTRSSARQESKDVSSRLKEVEGERDQYKREVKNLKRKLDETETYNNGSTKRRAVWAAVGAAAGAAVAAVVLNNLGIGIQDIAQGIAELSGRFFG